MIALLAACSPPDLDAAALAARLLPAAVPRTAPEAPALAADTHLMELDAGGELRFDRPLNPALRTTGDGRLGVDVRRRDGVFQLYLLGPEGEDELGVSAPGVRLVKDHEDLDPGVLYAEADGLEPNHASICDAAPGPYPCPSAPYEDCYDLTLVLDVQAACNDDGCEGPGEALETRLWGTPVTVAVADPKTAGATISSVTTGPPVAGPVFPVRGFFETSFTGDGRLLVARLDWTRLDLDGETRPVNVAYALADDACDVARWTEVHPISHLPFDPAAAGYGLAAAPFRDGEGHPIADLDEVGVSYPWVDRAGDNLFFTGVRATLWYDADPDPAVDDVRARYPARCLLGGPCDAPATADELASFEDGGVTRGVGVMGLWTRGKVVLFDSPLNHTDYGLGRDPEEHRLLRLYDEGVVRVGTGRDNGGATPLGASLNTSVIGSSEHHFFHASRPSTVRDVVWTIDTGHGSAEVAFDDLLDVDAFLVAEMGASLSGTDDEGRDALAYHDGFDPEPPFGPAGFRRPARFQNAATVLDWRVPPAGVAVGGVRVEPVALGGVAGKGAWLSGRGDAIVFPVPAQEVHDVATADWYAGLSVDPRLPDDGVVRSLLAWPDGSLLALEGRTALVVEDAGGVEVAWVPLPDPLPSGAWSHLATNLAGVTLEVLLDGMHLAEVTLPEPLLLPVEGALVLGDRPGDARDGFRGWVDELKVFARAMSPELACNHARGTLVEVGPGAENAWQDLADRYPPEAHEAIALALGAPGARYACFADRDVSPAVAANVAPLPKETTSVRASLLGGELAAGLARPDESGDPFCATCHADGQPAGLGLEALVAGTVPLEEDPRRQPMQAPALVFGNVPSGWLAPGVPLKHTVAPPEGMPLDPLLY